MGAQLPSPACVHTAHPACAIVSLERKLQPAPLLLRVLLLPSTGGNPWDVKKRKAKKKKEGKVDDAEEGDILENGDVRTKGDSVMPSHPRCLCSSSMSVGSYAS